MPAARAFTLFVCLSLLTGCMPAGTDETYDELPYSEPSDLTVDPQRVPGPTLPGCDGAGPAFFTDLQVRQVPDLPEPAARTSYRDPVYGGCVLRVTDRLADLSPDDPSAGIKNEYSRLQSFNADSSLILARSIEAFWYLYDALSLQPLGEVVLGDEPRWDATDPFVLYYFDELRLMRLDLRDGARTVAHDFRPDFPGRDISMVWTRYEGSPSADGATWGLMAEDSDWETVEFLIYDLPSDRITARLRLPRPSDVDNVTISPLGNYFLAQFEACPGGGNGDIDHPCGLMVYDRDLTTARGLLPIIGHSDTALDAAGREVFVFQDIQHDTIAMLDLASGAITDLFAIDFTYCDGCGMHFSGRAFGRPGWALVSYYDGDPLSHQWMDDHIFAVELKAGGRVVRFAAHHSVVDPDMEHDYWAEPHASVNRDFTRVLFTSNWGRSGGGAVDMYMIVLPADWSGSLP